MHTDKPLTIVKLQAENFKRLRAIEITPTGELITLGGNNAQGKSSVLDAIMAAFCGEKARPDKPVHEGEKRATVTVELGSEGKVELVLSLSISAGGTPALKVARADGGVMPKPQQYLDALTGGGFSFDPMDFARQKPRDQRETLLGLCKLDFSEIDTRRQNAFEERTSVNRQVKEADAQLKGVPFDPAAPANEASVAEISQRLQTALDDEARFSTKKGEFDNLRARLETGKALRQQTEAEIDALQKKLVVIDNQLIALSSEAEKAKAAAEDIPEHDIDAIRAELASVEGTNKRVQGNAQHLKLKEKLKGLELYAKKLTAEIEQADVDKQELLAKAPFPVKGLGFDDSGVTFQGQPFAQASQAEKVKVSVAMAMALNPRLRVITIREGALLDAASRAAVAQMAREKGVQVWMEDVGEHADTDFIIEDGCVRAAAPGAVPAPPATGAVEDPAPKRRRTVQA